MKLFKPLILTTLCSLFTFHAFAQQGKITAKVGVTVMDAPYLVYLYNPDGTLGQTRSNEYKRPQGTIFVSYSVLPRLSCGIYLGYTQLNAPDHVYPTTYEDPEMGQIVTHEYARTNTNAFNYGANVEFDILPPEWRIKLYAIGRVGMLSEGWTQTKTISSEEKDYHSQHCLEAAGGLGAAFYFTKRFGIYAEALGGRFRYEYFRWQAGFAFKF